MSIYDIYGNAAESSFDINGTQLDRIYSVNGVLMSPTPGELVFVDDFDGDSLNLSVWNYETGYLRNNELQVYCDSDKNVYLEDGNLVIRAIREPAKGYKGGVLEDFGWTSGSIQTNNKVELKYGRWEARVKFPGIVGSFPAFWTLGAGYDYHYNSPQQGNKGTKWPYCGEIDIVEHYPGGGNTTTHGAIYNTSPTADYGIDLGRKRSKSIDVTEYHVYAMEWTETEISFYVDDDLISTSTITDAMTMFRQPHFIILNLAIGSSGGTPPNDVDEMKMYVDWVRVYAPE